MQSFREVRHKLEMLSSISGAGNKKEFLRDDCLNDDLFVRVAQYALDADKTYSMKRPVPRENGFIVKDPDEVFTRLDELIKKGSADAGDKQDINIMAGSDPDLAFVLDRIIRKDLRCGVGATTINKLVPGTIFEVPYQRCSTEAKISNVTYPAIVQEKVDAEFAYAFSKPHPRTGKHFLTRNGKGYDLFGCITPDVPAGYVMVGELLVLDECGVLLPRKTSNGLVHKFIRSTGDKELAKRCRYEVWDLLTEEEFFAQKSKRPYIDRFDLLMSAMQRASGQVRVVHTKRVHTIAAAREFYKTVRTAGGEGAVLKDLQSKWKKGTARDLIKLVNVSEAEFIVTDAYEGESGKKYAGKLGGITVKTSDGMIESNVGSGFSDDERNLGVDWWKARVGRIVTIRFKEILSDKTARESKSLGNPRFVELREDKNEADTTAYCEELLK